MKKMKKMKYLFVIALTFAFFMIKVPVKADQSGPCNSEQCSIKIERVSESDAASIDPNLLTLNDGEKLYAVSVASKVGSSSYGTSFHFLISNDGSFEISDAINNYVPVGTHGFLAKNYISNDTLSIEQADESWVSSGKDADEEFTIGYLIVNDGYADAEFSIKFKDPYRSESATDVTLNGIKYNKTSEDDTINVDILFGDFKFDYVIASYNDDGSDNGHFEPVSSKSDLVKVDNTRSSANLYCNIEYYGDSKAGVFFHEYSYYPKEGDIGIENADKIRGYSSFAFTVAAKAEKTVRAVLLGGSEKDAIDILKNDGKIGAISLTISDDMGD